MRLNGGAILDPETARRADLRRALAALAPQSHTASHVVAERRERPEGIDDATFAWWIAAHRALWRRRFEDDPAPVPATGVAEVSHVDLRKNRLRKPSR